MFDDRRRGGDDDEDDGDLEFLNRAEDRAADDRSADDEAAAPPDGDGGDDRGEPRRAPPPVIDVRRRGGRGGRGIVAAVAVALVAMLAFVFWPRGGFELPPPVGEQTSVVTPDAPGQAYFPRQPVSGDVDLAQEAPAVVPETPGGREAQRAAAQRDPAANEEAGLETSAAAGTGVEAAPAGTAVVPPGASGTWAIQLGAFGQRANAEELVARLRKNGHRIETETVKTAGGASLTRVRVAWFHSEAEAAAWAAAHAADLGRDLKITSR
jgi:cell division septation protein DedD